jgi:hypothetical protein
VDHEGAHEDQDAGDPDEGHELQLFDLFDEDEWNFKARDDECDEDLTGVPLVKGIIPFENVLQYVTDAFLEDDDLQDADAHIIQED